MVNSGEMWWNVDVLGTPAIYVADARIRAIQPAYSQYGLHGQHDLHHIFCNQACNFCNQTCTTIRVAKFALQFFCLNFCSQFFARGFFVRACGSFVWLVGNTRRSSRTVNYNNTLCLFYLPKIDD